MGKIFGQLAYIRGIITYTLSPFEQRTFAGFSKNILNAVRRTAESSITVVPPFLIAYVVYDQVEKYHERLGRKNPEDYVNDQ